jgi:diguanylate cyclase (GGDEF)-like protein
MNSFGDVIARTGSVVSPQKRLLIVEDEYALAVELSEILEDLGHTVVAVAASSEEGLRAVEELHPDMVLMDLQIGGRWDSLQVASFLRTQCQLPVVYVTGAADTAAIERALGADPAGFVVKPYNPHAVRTTIAVALRRHEVEMALQRAHALEKTQREQRTQEVSLLARRLRHEATQDPQTGLFNRRHLDNVLRREMSFGLRNQHPVGAILLDLDDFQHVNEAFGHIAGATVLLAVGNYLRSRLRVYDVACRYVGEQIAVVAPGADTSAATALAEHLCTGISQLVIAFGEGVNLPVTASLGVASFPYHGMEPESVLLAAEAALGRAQDASGNCVVSAPVTGAGGVQAGTARRAAGSRNGWPRSHGRSEADVIEEYSVDEDIVELELVDEDIVELRAHRRRPSAD